MRYTSDHLRVFFPWLYVQRETVVVGGGGKRRRHTYEGEGRGQHEEQAVAVHGEGDGKVHDQAAHHKEAVHRRPVGHLQAQLHTVVHPSHEGRHLNEKGGGGRYLEGDGEQQAGLREDGEGLVVGHVAAVGAGRLTDGGVRDEEEHQGAVAAVQGALEEGHLAEVQVELARHVQLRVLEAPRVVHVL